MFEKLVADLLDKYLGQYVKDFNKENLKIGIWGGDVVLENLELKEDALNSFNVPFSVKKGFIGKIQLKIPWKNLKGQPVIVIIHNVYLVAQPQYSYAEYDGERERQSALKAKKAKLDYAEQMKQFNAEGADGQSDGFTQKLITKIIDNLQVEVKGIHIRLEDFTTNEKHPFAFGICMDSLLVKSTDEQWNPKFIENRVDKLIYKLAELRAFSVYFNPIKTSIADLSNREVIDIMSKTIATDPSSNEHQFVLRPITAMLHLKLNTSDVPDKLIPKMEIFMDFESIGIQVSQFQYQNLLRLLDSLSSYERVKQYLKFRPSIRPKDPGGARAWWQYAGWSMLATGNSVLSEVRSRIVRKSWKYIFERRKNRIMYVDFYKRKQKPKWLSPLTKEETATMEKLEEDLDYDDIIFFRSLAEVELKKETKNYEEFQEKKKQNSSWLSSWWSSSAPTEDEKQSFQLSNEDKQALWSTLDMDEVMQSIVLPKDYVKIRANIRLSGVSFSLFMRGATTLTDSDLLMVADLKEVIVNTDMRPESLKSEVHVKSFEIEDRYTKNNQFPKMIQQVKDFQGRGSYNINDNNSKFNLPIQDDELLHLVFEQNPLDGHANMAVAMAMNPLDIIVNKKALDKILDFFVPEERSEAAVEIASKAADSVSALNALTRAQLEDALNNHKTIDIAVSIKAPYIIIPENPTKKDTPLLVMDLGNLFVATDLQNARPVTKSVFASEVVDRQEDDFYDKFDVSLQGIKMLLVANNDVAWRNNQVQHEMRMHLVEEFDINLKLLNSIQPNEVSITKTKLRGSLPVLRVSFSTSKYVLMMRLLNSLTAPNKDRPEVAVPPPALDNKPAHSYPAAVTVPIQDKKPEEQDKTALAQRKIIEASFSIDDFFVTINDDLNILKRKYDNDEPGRDKLAVFRIEKFSVEFVQRTYDMAADVILHGMTLEHFTNGANSTTNYLITSKSEGSASHLVAVKYQQIQKDSPEYSHTDSTVDCSINRLIFICDSNAIVDIMTFGLGLGKIKIPNAPAQPDAPGRRGSVTMATSAITSAASSLKERGFAVNKRRPTKKRSHVKMQARVRMTGLGIRLLTLKRQPFFDFDITDMGVVYTQYDLSMGVKGYIGSMGMLNRVTPKGGERYSQVLSVVGNSDNNMLDFSYNTYHENEESFPGVNAEAGATIQSLRFVFINEVVMDLQSYFLNGPIMAALKDGSAPQQQTQPASKPEAPAEAQPATKILLSVMMNTPIVIVPVSATSPEYLQLELGTLSLRNRFAEVSQCDIDSMEISLKALNMKTFLRTTPDSEETQVYNLLQDVTLTAAVARMLDPSKCTETMPQMKISLDLSSMDFYVSNLQLMFLTNMLNQNITVTKPEPNKPSNPQPQPPNNENRGVAVDNVKNSIESALKDWKLKFDIDVMMKRMSLLLLTTAAPSNKTSTEQKLLNELAALSIENIESTLLMYVNGSMKMDMLLSNIQIEDLRAHSKNQFRRIMSLIPRPSSDIEAPNHLITMLYRKGIMDDDNLNSEANDINSQSIDLSLNFLRMIVVPDLLYDIQNFSMDAIKALPGSAPADPKTQAAAPPPPVVSKSLLKAEVILNEPEFVLVHNSHRADSKVLVLKTSMDISYKKEVNGESFMDDSSIHISKFQAYVSQLNEQSIYRRTMIRPLDMFLTYTNTPEMMDVNIKLHSMAMLFTYEDFKMSMAILNSLKPPAQPNANPAPVQKPAIESAQPAIPAVEKQEKMLFRSACMYLTLVNDFEGRHIPLAEFKFNSIDCLVKNWSSKMTVIMGVKFGADYYNNSIIQFEPMIEYSSVNLTMDSAESPQSTIKIDWHEDLNINVSHALLETVATIREILNRDYFVADTTADNNDSASLEVYSPYWVVNETGIMLTILDGDMKQDLAPGNKISLPNQQVKQPIDSDINRDNKYIDNAVQNSVFGRVIGVDLHGYSVDVDEIQVDKVGTRIFMVQKQTGNIVYPAEPVLCKVTLIDGSKVLQVQSLLTVWNFLGVSITVDFHMEEGEGKGLYTQAVTIEPGSSHPVPMGFRHSGLMRIRPSVPVDDSEMNTSTINTYKYEWSVQTNDLKLNMFDEMEPNQRAQFKHYFECKGSSGSFFSVATATFNNLPDGHSEVNLQIVPPICLENLMAADCYFKLQDPSTSALYLEGHISSGDSQNVHSIDIRSKDIQMSMTLNDYHPSEFFIIHLDGKNDLFKSIAEDIILKDAQPQSKRELQIKLDNQMDEKSTRRVRLYAPYWILNNTNLRLQFTQRLYGFTEDNIFGATVNAATVNEMKESPSHSEIEEGIVESHPIMFSFLNTIAAANNKLLVRVLHSEWSKPFNVENVGTNGVLSIYDHDTEREYTVGVVIYLAEGLFRRTIVIEFKPHYIFTNDLSMPIICKQINSQHEMLVKPTESLPFYYWMVPKILKEKPQQAAKDKKISVCLAPQDKNAPAEGWTSGFSVDEVGSTCLKLRDIQSLEKTHHFVEADMTEDYATIKIHFSKTDKTAYKIVNDTPFTIEFLQKGSSFENTTTLHERAESPYAWDDPGGIHQVHAKIIGENNMAFMCEYNLDVIENHSSIQIMDTLLFPSVKADGDVRVLTFTDKVARQDFQAQKVEKISTLFTLNMKGIGVSIVDKQPRELMYMRISELGMFYQLSNIDQQFQFVIKHFQIDNQLVDSHYPVFLAFRPNKKNKKLPFLQFSMVKNLENPTIDYFTYLSLLMQEMTLSVSDDYLGALMDFYYSLNSNAFGAAGPPVPTTCPTVVKVLKSDNPKLRVFPPGAYYFTYAYSPGNVMGPVARYRAKTEFTTVVLASLETQQGFARIFYVSQDGKNFHKFHMLRSQTTAINKGNNNNNNNKKGGTQATRDDMSTKITSNFRDWEDTTLPWNGILKEKPKSKEEERKMYLKLFMLNPIKLNLSFSMLGSKSPGGSSALDVVIKLVGRTFANLDNAPIKLNALVLEDGFISNGDLTARVTQHYTRQGLQEVYKILGSADFLGNPVGLFSNLGTGVMDFFFEPAQGLIKSPQDFGKGLAKGTISLVKNSVYGTFNTVSKITGAVSGGLATLTLDDEYIMQRQRTRLTERPKHVGEGLLYGAKDLGRGIVDGVTGVVTQPIKGAQEDGAVGFAKGVGKGLVGLPIKPVVGVIDFVSKTTEGIRNTTTMFEKAPQRSRLPRYVGTDKLLSSFSEKESEGLQLLYFVNEGMYKNEEYIFHEKLDKDDCILITGVRVMMITLKDHEEKWVVPLKLVKELQLTKLGVLVKFLREPEFAIIHMEDEARAMLIYLKLGAAAKAWKRAHNEPFKKKAK